MKFLLLIFVLATLAHKSDGAVGRALLKIGEPYSYDFGPNNSVIKRVVDNNTQFIYADTDYWTNEKKDKFDQGQVHYYANGTLVIDKVKTSDLGNYSLPDEPPQKRGENEYVGNSLIVFEEDK